MRGLIQDLRASWAHGLQRFRERRDARLALHRTRSLWLACADAGHDWYREDAAGQCPGHWLYRCDCCDCFEWAPHAPDPHYFREPEEHEARLGVEMRRKPA